MAKPLPGAIKRDGALRFMPIRLIATSLALIAFAAAVFGGIIASNPPTVVLGRAIVAMIGCYIVGLIVGGIAARAMREQVEAYKQKHPLPPLAADARDTPRPAAQVADTERPINASADAELIHEADVATGASADHRSPEDRRSPADLGARTADARETQAA